MHILSAVIRIQKIPTVVYLRTRLTMSHVQKFLMTLKFQNYESAGCRTRVESNRLIFLICI